MRVCGSGDGGGEEDAAGAVDQRLTRHGGGGVAGVVTVLAMQVAPLRSRPTLPTLLASLPIPALMSGGG